MSRDALINLLTRHLPHPHVTNDVYYVDCYCGESFRSGEEWAGHVANAIYPRE